MSPPAQQRAVPRRHRPVQLDAAVRYEVPRRGPQQLAGGAGVLHADRLRALPLRHPRRRLRQGRPRLVSGRPVSETADPQEVSERSGAPAARRATTSARRFRPRFQTCHLCFLYVAIVFLRYSVEVVVQIK